MTILNFPACRISEATFGFYEPVRVFESPMDGSVQIELIPAARWSATYHLTAHRRETFAAIQAFLIKCRGGSVYFYGHDPDAKTPRGVATGTPIINGAGQTGTSIITSGWTPNVSGILLQGDYIQVGTQLRQVCADANSDGSGNATLDIGVPFRVSPANNAPIITNQASCVMRLVDNTQGKWDTDMNRNYITSFSAVEVFVD